MTSIEAFGRSKQKLQKRYEQLIGLLRETEILTISEDDLLRLTSVRARLDQELLCRVLCLGDFSTGKSSFINRFLLKEEVLPAWSTPTTAQITRINHGERLKATRYQAGSGDTSNLVSEVAEEAIPEKLQKWVAVNNQNAQTEGALPINVEVPSPLLKAGIEIVDSPGLNDPNTERMRLTLDYLNHADAILFFINGTRPWTRYEKEVFEGEVLGRDMLDRVFIVVNYWDLIEEDQRSGVIEYIENSVRESLGYDPRDVNEHPIVPILPVSSKTGENEELIQRQVWDVLSQRKSEEVLSYRIASFNREVEALREVLGRRIENLGLDHKGRSTRRERLTQEIKEYEEQKLSSKADLKRLLELDFQEFQDRFQRLFESLEHDLAGIPNEIGEPQDTDSLNRQLSQHISRMHKRTSRKLLRLDSEFGQQLRDTIETHKATIGALPSSAATMEEYVFLWRAVDGKPLVESTPFVAGGFGAVGLLLGVGTLWHSSIVASATPGALANIGAFVLGAPAATASSFLLIGLPALAIGGLLVGTAFFAKHKNASNLRKALANACVELSQNIEDEKWRIVDQMRDSRYEQIAQICENVDDDISRTWRKRLEELQQAEADENQGTPLADLNALLSTLILKVNV